MSKMWVSMHDYVIVSEVSAVDKHLRVEQGERFSQESKAFG